MALYEDSGTDITANWVTGGAAPGTSTGLEENGTDMGDIYTWCSDNDCGSDEGPICSGPQSFNYNPANDVSFWHGTCQTIGS